MGGAADENPAACAQRAEAPAQARDPAPQGLVGPAHRHQERAQASPQVSNYSTK